MHARAGPARPHGRVARGELRPDRRLPSSRPRASAATSPSFCAAKASQSLISGSSFVSCARSTGTCSRLHEGATISRRVLSRPLRPAAASPSAARRSVRQTLRPSTTPSDSHCSGRAASNAAPTSEHPAQDRGAAPPPAAGRRCRGCHVLRSPRGVTRCARRSRAPWDFRWNACRSRRPVPRAWGSRATASDVSRSRRCDDGHGGRRRSSCGGRGHPCRTRVGRARGSRRP